MPERRFYITIKFFTHATVFVTRFCFCFSLRHIIGPKNFPDRILLSVRISNTRLGSVSLYIFLSTNAHWRNEEQVSERQAKMTLGL